MSRKISIIGVGSMGGAILEGIISSDVFKKNEIVLVEPDIEKSKFLKNKGFFVVNHIDKIDCIDIAIIAVKPQQFNIVASEIVKSLKLKVVISVMAGINTSVIKTELNNPKDVIRCMPNLACRIGKGMTAISNCPSVNKESLDLVRKIFKTIGETIPVDESLFDVVTALSGSGPGFLFRCIESLSKAGIKEGLDPEVSEKLARYVAIGTGGLLESTNESVSILRAGVTSKGGTTEAGLEQLEIENIDVIFEKVIGRSKQRSIEL